MCRIGQADPQGPRGPGAGRQGDGGLAVQAEPGPYLGRNPQVQAAPRDDALGIAAALRWNQHGDRGCCQRPGVLPGHSHQEGGQRVARGGAALQSHDDGVGRIVRIGPYDLSRCGVVMQHLQLGRWIGDQRPIAGLGHVPLDHGLGGMADDVGLFAPRQSDNARLGCGIGGNLQKRLVAVGVCHVDRQPHGQHHQTKCKNSERRDAAIFLRPKASRLRQDPPLRRHQIGSSVCDTENNIWSPSAMERIPKGAIFMDSAVTDTVTVCATSSIVTVISGT